MSSLRLEHCYQRFRESIAINDVNVAIDYREFLVLGGPSVCGKSTTLRLMRGSQS